MLHLIIGRPDLQPCSVIRACNTSDVETTSTYQNFDENGSPPLCSLRLSTQSAFPIYQLTGVLRMHTDKATNKN